MAEDDLYRAARRRIGQVLRGKYRLDRVIGVGGMAAVFAATHRNSKQFAVKMLHPGLSGRDDVKTRFLREGYVANSVQHPGAVAVLDDDVAQDGSAFLVMELLLGAQVNDLWTKHDKRLPLGVVLSIGDALLDVLASAHSHGVVHRDIKPPNLFITSDGVLKVLDFGIARLRDDLGGGSATVTGTLMGTPAFMAPEQALAKGGEIDAQTDLWAVGATMFSLLGGEIVHTGDNASQLLVNAATKPARALASVAKEAPKAVAAVVDRALAFDKAGRWPTASAMREALSAACLEATGAPVAALPKPEATIAEVEETLPESRRRWTDAAFAPTVDPSVPDPPRGITTTGPAATSKPTVPDRPSRRRPWRRISAALAAGGAFVVAAAASYQHQNRPRTRHCAVVSPSRQGPRCAVEVSPAVIAGRRERTALVTEARGLTQSIEWIGVPSGDADDLNVVREDMMRDSAGQVTQVIRKDWHGTILEWERWSSAEGGHRIDLVDLDGTSPRVTVHTGISTIVREYDERGRVSRERYFGPSGRPRATASGVYGASFEYGSVGRWQKMHVLGADGQPGVDVHGRATYVRSDDASPTGRESRALGQDGKPMTIDGVSADVTSFDEAFNVTLSQHVGAHEEPAVSTASGSHGVRQRWDGTGRVLETTDLDERDQARPRRGESAATTRTTNDAHGLALLVESVDANGNRTRRRGDGVSATRFTRSDAGDEILREYLDPDGGLMLGEGGYARRKSAYDAHGNPVQRRYFDEALLPIASKGGAALERFAVDDRGLETRASNFDGDERPVADAHGVHETRRKWDRLRNKIEEAYFDVDGRPTVNEAGISIIRWTYDDADDLASVQYFDEAAAPVMVRGEKAAERWTHDERGLVLSSETLDAHGDRTLRSEGYAAVRYSRDHNGDVVSESYFGKHDELVPCNDGYSRKTMKYDAQRRVIEVALEDAQGDPVLGAEGWASRRTQFDGQGLVVRDEFLGILGKPVLVKDRGAAVTKKWDARGNLLSETSLGEGGQPEAPADGYATRSSEYDAQDRLVLHAYLGVDGSPAPGKDGTSLRRIRYDEASNIVEESYFDRNHAAMSPKGMSYASVHYTFDARQRLVETSFFDATGAPTGADGIATVRYVRDGYGRPTETSFFDRAGRRAKSPEGKSVIRSTYDAAGRLVLERFLSPSGALESANDGCAAYRLKYDSHGRNTETTCLSAKEEPTRSKAGYASQRIVHDGRGNEVDVSTWDESGLAIVDGEGIARRHQRFDDRNLLIGITYFDPGDRPTRDKRGVHETRYTYSETGKVLAPLYFDELGSPVTLDRAPLVVVKDLPPLPPAQ